MEVIRNKEVWYSQRMKNYIFNFLSENEDFLSLIPMQSYDDETLKSDLQLLKHISEFSLHNLRNQEKSIKKRKWISVEVAVPLKQQLVWVFSKPYEVFLGYKDSVTKEKNSWRHAHEAEQGLHGGTMWLPITSPIPPVEND